MSNFLQSALHSDCDSELALHPSNVLISALREKKEVKVWRGWQCNHWACRSRKRGWTCWTEGAECATLDSDVSHALHFNARFSGGVPDVLKIFKRGEDPVLPSLFLPEHNLHDNLGLVHWLSLSDRVSIVKNLNNNNCLVPCVQVQIKQVPVTLSGWAYNRISGHSRGDRRLTDNVRLGLQKITFLGGHRIRSFSDSSSKFDCLGIRLGEQY